MMIDQPLTKGDAMILGTLYFSKRFLSGPLHGLIVPCRLTHATDQTASAYRIGSTGRDRITKSKWEVVDASFQNYQRN